MDEFRNLILILAVLISIVTAILCLIAPVRFVQILFLWPKTLKKLTGIKFPAGGDEALALIYADPSSYAMKYSGQIEMIRLMGVIAGIVGVVGLCKLLDIF